MSKVISLVIVLVAAGALAAWASGGIGRHHAEHKSNSSIAVIADASTSFAEFSSKVPDLRAARTSKQR